MTFLVVLPDPPSGSVVVALGVGDEVPVVIAESLAINDRPVIVEFVVDDQEMLWPMVVAGGNNDDVHFGPDTVIGDAAHRPRII